jgi:drug/metabolite transporter (DMT)-like permease
VLSGQSLGVVLALGATVTFSGAILLSTIGSRHLNSDAGALLSGATNVPVGLLLLLLQLAVADGPSLPTWRGAVGFAAGGLCGTFLGRWLFFSTIRMLGPTRATVFQTLSPLAAALLAWAFFGEHLPWAGRLGMLLAIAGLVLMSPRRPVHDAIPGKGTSTRIALAFGLGSAVAYAASSLFRDNALQHWNEPLAGALLGALAGLFALTLTARKRLSAVRAQIRAHPTSARHFVGVGALQIMAQAQLIASLNHIPVALAVLLTSCTPLLVMPLSHWLLRRDETLNGRTVTGVIVTCTGVALAMIYTRAG